MAKGTCRSKGVFGLHFQITVYHSRKSGELKAGSWKQGWCRGHGGFAPHGCFFADLRTTSSGDGSTHNEMGPPTSINNWEAAVSFRDIFSIKIP